MSKTVVGKLDAISVFMCWFLLGLFFTRLVYEQFFSNAEIVLFSWYIFAVFIVFLIFHVILAFFNRCPNCSKMLTAQGFKKPHPNSSGDWSNVVWHWFSGSIVCIHCGKEVNTNDL
jgi:hypothetical protein